MTLLRTSSPLSRALVVGSRRHSPCGLSAGRAAPRRPTIERALLIRPDTLAGCVVRDQPRSREPRSRRREAPRSDRDARGDRERPFAARRAPARGANPPADRRGGRVQPRRRPEAPLREGAAQAEARCTRRGGRVAPRRDRDPRAARASPCSRPRTSSPRRRSSGPTETDDARREPSRSSTATCASSTTASSTTSTTSSARPCADVQLRQAHRDGRPRAGASRCSPAAASRSATRPGSSCCARARTLIVTTRFPRDAAARYAQEPDFDGLGRPARDLRARPAPHAERRGVLPPPADAPATGSTSSSTTPARPCAGRPSFYRHMMERESAAAGTRCPTEAARLLGGVRRACARYDMLEGGDGGRRGAAARDDRGCVLRRAVAGARCSPRSSPARRTSSPRAGSTRTSSRSTSATATRGGSRSPRSRRSSCSRRSSSTPSRRSCSTRG